MMELVLVVALLCMPGATAAPLFDQSSVQARAAAEVPAADIRFAQSPAMRQNSANNETL
ncbi:MAG: hypothetical protein V1736_09090 [Pseudomonadota bacterium]